MHRMCAYVYLRVCLYLRICAYVYMCVCICVYVYMYMGICVMCMSVYRNTWACICVCRVGICVHAYACMCGLCYPRGDSRAPPRSDCLENSGLLWTWALGELRPNTTRKPWKVHTLQVSDACPVGILFRPTRSSGLGARTSVP